jgi:tRNA pseudouridine38-40 synthase
MPTFKITLAYDGTDFVGWQRQATGTSIQGLLEAALRKLDARAVTVIGAGRTDAGVHALGQVASFSLERDIDADVLVRALNARLPASVRVWSARPVPSTFHARFAARAKSYRYHIWNGPVLSPFDRQYAWHIAGALDVAAMSEAARRLEGRHDFAAFQGTGSEVATTERTIMVSRIVAPTGFDLRVPHVLRGGALDTRCDLRVPVLCGGEFPRGALITYEITGDGFLRHMVRNIVGTLVDIGLGRRTPESVDAVLAARDRSAAGPTAPARGLLLVAVDYGC